MIVKWAKDKPIMEKKVSAKNIQIRDLKKNLKKIKRKKLYPYQQQIGF